MPPAARGAVNKLSSILRLACALADFVDPERRLAVKIQPDFVTIRAEDGATMQLGDGTLVAEAEHFHYVFARKIIFR